MWNDVSHILIFPSVVRCMHVRHHRRVEVHKYLEGKNLKVLNGV